jgi:hypothetical protein
MGFCNVCGSPCPVCSGEADEFNLLVFPEEVRRIITLVLTDMGLNNPTHQSDMVNRLVPYKEKPAAIVTAGREFLQKRDLPRSIPYFVAMVKRKAVAKKKRLDALPPEV